MSLGSDYLAGVLCIGATNVDKHEYGQPEFILHSKRQRAEVKLWYYCAVNAYLGPVWLGLLQGSARGKKNIQGAWRAVALPVELGAMLHKTFPALRTLCAQFYLVFPVVQVTTVKAQQCTPRSQGIAVATCINLLLVLQRHAKHTLVHVLTAIHLNHQSLPHQIKIYWCLAGGCARQHAQLAAKKYI